MNIILLISDTFRADNLRNDGPMPVRTPSLDAFAGRAVSMSRFMAGSFPTIPHRTDLITGRFGWPWYGWQDLDLGSANALPPMLGDSGYVTQLICDCPHLFPAGFEKRFNAAHAVRGQEGDLHLLRMNHPIDEVMPRAKTRPDGQFRGNTLVDLHCWMNPDRRGEKDRFPPRTAELAVEWLEENHEFSPFFLWVDFFDPHEPWDPPEYMVRRYDPDYDGTPMLHPNYGNSDAYSPDELRNMRAHYCAEAELVDRWVGRVLQKIDDLALWDSTIVVFTSDHGISLGEHQRTGKLNRVGDDPRYWPIYPEIAHVPFLVAAPGLDGGRVVDGFAQSVDIAPTLADLAGVKVEPPEPFHGLSLAPHLRGEDAPGPEFVISATWCEPGSGRPPIQVPTPVVYTRQWAYAPVGALGRPELYDLETDPMCERDVIADHARGAGEMHDRFEQWLASVGAPAEVAARWHSG